MKRFLQVILVAAAVCGTRLLGTPAAFMPVEIDHYLASRPENIVWGWFPLDAEPALRINSGETVSIDTLTGSGATQDEEPVVFLTQFGIQENEILQDTIDFWSSRAGRPREGRGAHLLTGPIYMEGAEPGDVLKIEILSLETRVPWGFNSTSATGGVFSSDYPGYVGEELLDIQPWTRHLIRTGMSNRRHVALFADGIEVPMSPFMGIMAVAPENPAVGQPGVTVAGVQGSSPPGPFGGNMDVRDLGAGTTLYLPVFHPGALFYVGDPHGVQGDGEVSGTALEQSLSGTFRFSVLKGKSIDGPWAENDTHYILLGIDADLDRAMRKAVREVVDFLVTEKGLTPAKALSLASLGVDFRIGEAVSLTQVVTAHIPKEFFLWPRHAR